MLNYCIVKQRIGAITEDTPDDDDRYPDYTSVFGQVVFAPTMANGSAYKITDNDGVVHTVPATRITAQIVNGEIVHEGLPGLPLFAAGPNANPSTIVYTATYTNLTAAGIPVTLNNITFRALPGETIDLSSYTPVAGAPTPGIIQGPPGHTPYIGDNGNWWINVSDTGVAATSPLVHSYAELTEAFEENTLRVKALEAMGGLSPESPVDGQTANLISQPDTLTRAAIAASRVDMEVSASQSTATLGPELVTSAGWTLGAGWSGDLASGFTHVAGDTSILEWDATGLERGSYVVSFDIGTNGVPPIQNLDVTLSDSDVPYIYGRGTRYAGVLTTTSGILKFTPVSSTPWAGTIIDVSVKKVVGITPAELSFVDEEGNVTAGVRTGLADEKNFFAGNVAGQNNSSGDGNTAIGIDTMGANTTGSWNTALGWEALKYNTSGTRNIAIGQRTLVQNTSGYRNTVVGQSAMVQNTTGHTNVSIGADSMLQNRTGYHNVAIGMGAIASGTTATFSVGIGSHALQYGDTTRSVAIGWNALNRASGDNNTAVGSQALRYSKGESNTSLGASTGLYNVSGTNNILIGIEAGRGVGLDKSDFNNVTAIGREVGRMLGTGDDDNTLVGHTVMKNAAGGIDNTIVGSSAGLTIYGSVINHNVVIGKDAGRVLSTGGDKNTVIGTNAGRNITSGESNILIGYDVQSSLSTASNEINIGGVFRGSNAPGGLLARLMGDVEMPNLPKQDPQSKNKLWNDNGTLKVSAG